jgi:hypothetical protein
VRRPWEEKKVCPQKAQKVADEMDAGAGHACVFDRGSARFGLDVIVRPTHGFSSFSGYLGDRRVPRAPRLNRQ